MSICIDIWDYMVTIELFGAIHIKRRETSTETIPDAKADAQCEWTLKIVEKADAQCEWTLKIVEKIQACWEGEVALCTVL